MSGLKLTNVRKAFGDTVVLENINLEIADGELIVFVGPSGCGKSTLLRLIAGLDDVTSGEIAIAGKIVNDVAPAQRGIAMVFQSYALYPHMTAYQNMSFGLRLPSSKEEIDARCGRPQLHIERPLDVAKDALRRLASARRHRPSDRAAKVFVRRAAVELDAAPVPVRYGLLLHAELGTTMIYVTHDQIEAMTSPRIVVLSASRVEQVGTPM